jgi:hypothetical protein
MVYASDTLTFAELAQVRPGPYLPEQSPGFTFQDLTFAERKIRCEAACPSGGKVLSGCASRLDHKPPHPISKLNLTNGLTVSNRSAYNVCKGFAMTYVTKYTPNDFSLWAKVVVE